MLYKQKVFTMLMLAVLTLSIISVFTIPIPAEPVPKPGIVDWLPGGEDVHNSLECNPEYLKVWTATHVSHDTWIHVIGKDTFGQDIEAKVLISESTPPEREFVLVDWFSRRPVTFTKITGVFQQGGEHCNVFQIHTFNYGFQQRLGMYHVSTGYEPTGAEPYNPEPLKIFVEGALWDSTITIKGLDQRGDILEVPVFIPAGSTLVPVEVPGHSWSVVCEVWGGIAGISYYIYTHPQPQRAIFEYRIRVDHISVTATPKNILADGDSESEICITLLDQDGHEVHWTVDAPPVEINVAASGGQVSPSVGIYIWGTETHTYTWLRSDTNARIVKVTALAIIPAVGSHPGMQLTCSDIVCFDGVNSVPYEKTHETVDIGGTGSGRRYAVFLRLNEGCNLISIPVIPDEALNWGDLPDAGQSLISVATFRADAGVWLYFDFPSGVGDPIPIVDGWAYWVKAEKPCTLVISGRHMDQFDPDTGFGFPPAYGMVWGWNFVGVTTTRPWVYTADYLESLKSYQGSEKLWGPVWVYREGAWTRDPIGLRSGEGMWLFTLDGTLAP